MRYLTRWLAKKCHPLFCHLCSLRHFRSSALSAITAGHVGMFLSSKILKISLPPLVCVEYGSEHRLLQQWMCLDLGQGPKTHPLLWVSDWTQVQTLLEKRWNEAHAMSKHFQREPVRITVVIFLDAFGEPNCWYIRETLGHHEPVFSASCDIM